MSDNYKMFNAGELPDVDQMFIKRGKCPWCLRPLIDGSLMGHNGDVCPACENEFIGSLTVND